MSLVDQIASKAKEIHTDGYPMSLGEVLSLYRDGDIDIHPEFQRIFRWTDDQKSRLIESILLGIPVPPVFVSQRDDGVWDVIDGVQRLSTIFQFVGLYRDHDGNLADPLVLKATEYLPALEGYRWEDDGPEEPNDGVEEDAGQNLVFTSAMQRDFKRSKLEFQIIRKESDVNAKYDLFQRLNSDAVLSAQEARNCLMVMISLPMYDKVTELSLLAPFLTTVPLSERQEDQAYRQELVLRFFAQADFSGTDAELRQEYGEYLTAWMRSAAESFGQRNEKIHPPLFRGTFDLLNKALGEDAFRRFDGNKHLGPFSISCYEFVTSGVSANLAYWETQAPEVLAERVRKVWLASDFRDHSGTGMSPRRRVPRLVLRSRKFFSETGS